MIEALPMQKQSDRLGTWLRRWLSRLSGKSRARLNMLERERLTVNSHLEELASVQEWFRTLVSRLAVKTPWLNEQFDQLNLALAEGFTNAVRHAHADLPAATPIEIELVLQPQKIEICIFDQGAPFDPNSLSEPQPGTLREGGYGWFLLRRLADQVTYDRTPTCAMVSSEGASGSVSDGGSSSAPSAAPNSAPSQAVRAQPRNCLRIVKNSSAHA